MSIQAVAWTLDQEDFPHTHTGRCCTLVLLAIANHADETSGHCFPRVEYIAKKARCSERAVYRFVSLLRQNGFLDVQQSRNPNNGRQRASNYWIRFDRPRAPWINGKADSDPDEMPETDAMIDETQDVVVRLTPESVCEIPNETQTDCGTVCGTDDHRLTPESGGQTDSGVSLYIMPESSDRESSATGTVALAPQNAPSWEAPAMEPTPAVAPPERPPEGLQARAPSDFDPRRRLADRQRNDASEARRRTERVFVYENSLAWKAWLARTPRGFPTTQHPTTGGFGWWFESLFPPAATDRSGLSAADAAAMANELSARRPA